MPELPEVEIITVLLKPNLVGKMIADITVLEPKIFHGNGDDIRQQKIVDVTRKGKVASIKLSNSKYISFHLKMSGQMLYADNVKNASYPNPVPRADSSSLPAKTTKVIFTFTDGSGLFFNDMRKFGWVKISDKPEGPTSPDALSDEFSAHYLFQITQSSRKPIKVLLMDQEKIAGIGNIYANDSLWEAGIHPARIAHTLTEKETAALHSAIKTVLSDSIKHQGSSADDELYILPNGEKGTYQHRFRVYHQHNSKCKKCSGEIKRIKQAGRSSFFCVNCQISDI